MACSSGGEEGGCTRGRVVVAATRIAPGDDAGALGFPFKPNSHQSILDKLQYPMYLSHQNNYLKRGKNVRIQNQTDKIVDVVHSFVLFFNQCMEADRSPSTRFSYNTSESLLLFTRCSVKLKINSLACMLSNWEASYSDSG